MLYFNKNAEGKLVGDRNTRNQYKHVVDRQVMFNKSQNAMRQMYGNASAIIPQDLYREFDTQAQGLYRQNDLVLMNDLMTVGKSLPVGTIEHMYRQSSSAGVVDVSLLSETPTQLDKTDYTYDSSIKVIHKSSFGRSAMEMEVQNTDAAFDALMDDQENVVRAVRESIADHFYNGKDVTFKGTAAYGIKTSSKVQAVDLGPSGLNIDFTSSSASATDIRTAWIGMIYALRTTNNISEDIKFYISAEIEQNFQRIYDSSGGMADETIMTQLKKLAGVADIVVDRKLSGNEVVGLVLNSRFIRPLVGMAVATVPLFRANPFDSYNFLVWSNVGLEIRTDATGKTGVLYASVTSTA